MGAVAGDVGLFADEIDKAEAMWASLESKRIANEIMQKALRSSVEQLSLTKPWKTKYLENLEAGFAECKTAGLDASILKEYKEVVDAERRKRMARLALEKAAPTKGDRRMK